MRFPTTDHPKTNRDAIEQDERPAMMKGGKIRKRVLRKAYFFADTSRLGLFYAVSANRLT
jgi:hypothetical protein